MARRLKLELGPGLSAWRHGDSDVEVLAEPIEVDVTGQPELEAAIGAAVSAGALVIAGGEPAARASVESEEDSLAKYETAQEARASLFEQRDRELLGTSRVELTDDEVADAGVSRMSMEYARLAAAKGSEWHQVLVEWEDRMAAAAQEALEGSA